MTGADGLMGKKITRFFTAFLGRQFVPPGRAVSEMLPALIGSRGSFTHRVHGS